MAAALKNPNLPEREVRLAAIGEGYAESLYPALNRLRVSILPVPMNPEIDPRLAFHADMSLFHCNETDLILAKSISISTMEKSLSGYLIHTAALDQKQTYPGDCSLNACRIGAYLLHNTEHTDPSILGCLPKGCTKLHVRQGYTKCAVCILDERHIITSDAGIAKTLRQHGIDALEICQGHIVLDGYNTGFIGGCCGKLAKDLIVFTGHLRQHPDSERILRYIAAQNIRVEYLTDRPLFDIGSILPLMEV